MYEGIFKFNVINKVVVSTYIVDSYDLWHNILGHVNVRRMHDMFKINCLPYFDKSLNNCKTCMLIKITKTSFPQVERCTKLLELIHSNVYDF